MGLPEIFISFQTAAVSAITRSARGMLAVALKDATEGGAAEAAYKSLAEVPEDKFSPENYRLRLWMGRNFSSRSRTLEHSLMQEYRFTSSASKSL